MQLFLFSFSVIICNSTSGSSQRQAVTALQRAVSILHGAGGNADGAGEDTDGAGPKKVRALSFAEKS